MTAHQPTQADTGGAPEARHARPRHDLPNALLADDPSVRLNAAMTAGSNPDPSLLDTLVERCAIEPDFFVRDSLTWALTRLPADITLPRLRTELDSTLDQARSQALHTLSKIADSRAWPWITPTHLRDPNDDVARTAWRAAVRLVPDDDRGALAEELISQLGRGDRSVQLSLSRALVDLGSVIDTALTAAANHLDQVVAAHARATQLLQTDPTVAFEAAIDTARRTLALGPDN